MILVTGGSGLLGAELIMQLLARGEEVIATFNRTPLPIVASHAFRQVECNILDIVGLEEIMIGVEQVYHSAAIVSYEPSRKKELFKTNIEGTANVVNAALHAGVQKLVHVSSVAALGREKNTAIVEETMNWTEETGSSNYGQSKYFGELEVWRGIGEGLNAIIVNPAVILGSGDWNSGSSQIFKTAYNEFPWYTEGVTGFVDVGDVAKVMIALMESNINGERFIISAENKSYHQIFDLMAGAFGKRKPHKKVTPFLAKIVWRVEALKTFFTGQKSLLTRETAINALAIAYFNNSKLKRFLPGFEYKKIEDTIKNCCAAFQQKINNH